MDLLGSRLGLERSRAWTGAKCLLTLPGKAILSLTVETIFRYVPSPL